eukprot:XP_012951135.2 calcium-binding tyrosine phosphorylation-regulated protein [Anas platyrhynchos]
MTELSVPESLHTLLEGVTAAVIKNKPVDTAEFVALYFQDFIAFHRDNLNLNLEEVVKKFHFKYENPTGELERKAPEHRDISISGEPQKKEVSTDTEEDQLLEDIAIEYSSKVIQCPSAASSVAENKPSTGPDGASSPEGPELAYVPADPEQLATHILGNTDSAYSVRDVATSVQTLNEDSQASETSFTLVDDDEEDDAAALAAGASVEAVRSQPGVQCYSPVAGEPGPSDSQADVSANYAEQVSSSLLQEDPFLPPPPPPPSLSSQWQLQVAPPSSAAEAISTAEGWDKPTVDAEVPPFTEQFPEKIIIPFIEQTAYLLKIGVGQVSCAKTLGPPAAAAVCQPEGVESAAHMESAEQVYVMSG